MATMELDVGSLGNKLNTDGFFRIGNLPEIFRIHRSQELLRSDNPHCGMIRFGGELSLRNPFGNEFGSMISS